MPDAPALCYPALAACIAQDRAPRPDEVDRVARRVIREWLNAYGDRDDAVIRRLAAQVARTALTGGRTPG